MSKLTQYFWTLAEQAPSLLAILACLVFALSRWKRNSRVSLVVTLALALLIVHVIVFLFVYDLVPPIFLKGALSQTFEQMQRTRTILFLVLGLIYNSFLAVGFGLLLAAIFMQRSQTQSES
ncbi:MAG TPA: hypothetical protein VGQ72_12865 [Pyrinomonadaceae bacterium]|jgi:hypothetical protein|nr:hypothetical protein [Pyrinomonadaceae bacterium]